jgi:hypothetical protein
MLDRTTFVFRYPWDDSAKRMARAFVELRRASVVKRDCFASFSASRDAVLRRDLAEVLQGEQRVWQLASREYTAALAAHITILRADVACPAH